MILLYGYLSYSAKLIVLFTINKALDVIPACFKRESILSNRNLSSKKE